MTGILDAQTVVLAILLFVFGSAYGVLIGRWSVVIDNIHCGCCALLENDPEDEEHDG